MALSVEPKEEGAAASPFTVRRCPQNPIIRPEMLPEGDGGNINGPCLIRVPDWVTGALGRYYLYFAHHNGRYIRMAYADNLEGPWKVHQPGVLRLADAPGCAGHVASPDVIVDEERREFRLYFHGPLRAGGKQVTFVAVSKDGLGFKAGAEALCPFYFRAFRWDGMWYGMSKGGLLFRSRDGLSGFVEGPNPFPGSAARDKPVYNKPGPRHLAVWLARDRLWVYFSSIGAQPERILRGYVDLAPDWAGWRVAGIEEVLRPEAQCEGADLPLTPSRAGAAPGRENAVRDPHLFVEAGRTYLVYSVAGESGLALAEIVEER